MVAGDAALSGALAQTITALRAPAACVAEWEPLAIEAGLRSFA